MMGLKLKGFKVFEKAIDAAGFKKACRKSLMRTAGIVGKLAEAQVRKTIAEGKFADNADLTVALKGSNEPLKGTKGAELWNSISSTVVSWNKVFIGVKRSDGKYQVAVAVHNGTIIKVTPAMRGMFLYLHYASTGEKNADGKSGEALLTSERAKELFRLHQNWMPLKSTTTNIVIPARPFFEMAFADKEFQENVRKYWMTAVKRAFMARLKRGD
jgi:hypothetical protein